MKKYKLDDWGVLYNHPDNFELIRNEINKNKAVCFQWTDKEGSMYTIIITKVTAITNQLSRGCKANYIFVSAVGYGCMGFAPNGPKLFPSYVSEKLGVPDSSFTELLNKIIRNETIC